MQNFTLALVIFYLLFLKHTLNTHMYNISKLMLGFFLCFLYSVLITLFSTAKLMLFAIN